MRGFHLRATGNCWRERIVVIAVVVLVVMKWVDEWPADITLGPEQNIYSRRPQRDPRTEEDGSGRGRKIADNEWVGAPYTMTTDQSTLGRPPLVLFFSPPLFSPILIFTRGLRLQPQSPVPPDYRLSRVAGYIPTTIFPVEFQYSFLSFFRAILLFSP